MKKERKRPCLGWDSNFRPANSPKKKASVSVANGITFTRPRIDNWQNWYREGGPRAPLSLAYTCVRGEFIPLYSRLYSHACACIHIYIYIRRCSRMQEEKEEVRTLLLPFLGQSLNCAECFAVVKVYARYRGLLWPCFDHWLSMAWQFRWVLFRETLSVDVVKWFFIPSLSRERYIRILSARFLVRW